MHPVRVSVINASKSLKDSEIPPVIAALRIQVSDHLAPRWNIDATLEFVPAGQTPPDGNWQLIIDDDTDIMPPVSGYHNVTPAGVPYPNTRDGIPYGKVFVNTAKKRYNENWTITASHELLEMLVNPYAVVAAYVPANDQTGVFYSLEICDPVARDACGYEIDGISVSDFVFPEWFSPFLAQPDPNKASKQVDYCKRLSGPAPAIAAETSVSIFGGWHDFQSPEAPGQTAGARTRR
jgi:hypothetical protein